MPGQQEQQCHCCMSLTCIAPLLLLNARQVTVLKDSMPESCNMWQSHKYVTSFAAGTESECAADHHLCRPLHSSHAFLSRNAASCRGLALSVHRVGACQPNSRWQKSIASLFVLHVWTYSLTGGLQ